MLIYIIAYLLCGLLIGFLTSQAMSIMSDNEYQEVFKDANTTVKGMFQNKLIFYIMFALFGVLFYAKHLIDYFWNKFIR